MMILRGRSQIAALNQCSQHEAGFHVETFETSLPCGTGIFYPWKYKPGCLCHANSCKSPASSSINQQAVSSSNRTRPYQTATSRSSTSTMSITERVSSRGPIISSPVWVSPPKKGQKHSKQETAPRLRLSHQVDEGIAGDEADLGPQWSKKRKRASGEDRPVSPLVKE